MSCLILHWKFQFIYSALNLMFLLDFSLHFFKVNASTKLDFLNAQYLTLGGGDGEKKNTTKCQLAYSSFGFSWPWISLVTLCVCAAGAWPCGCINMPPLPFPFMSRSTFVISQLEQHDLELFKAACTFCIKKYEKERKKAKRQKVI